MTHELQDQLSEFWSKRPGAKSPGTMVMRSDREQQAWDEALRPLLPTPPTDVLDVGTGQGFLAQLLADLGHHVIGIDTAEGMLDAARAHAAGSASSPEFRLGDAMDPPLPSASLDVVCNRQVVWTLLDPERAFRNWFGLLRPGGRLVSVQLRQNVFGSGSDYPPEVITVLPPLRLEASGEALVTRFDRNYANALANLARETGFVDVELTSLEAVDRFEEEIGTERRWLAVTGRKPVADLNDLQARINTFWTWRGNTIQSGGLAIRDERELKTWMEILRTWLPPAPADVVDLGTGQGFLALVLAALGHRVRGFDLAEGQLDRAREFGAQVSNPPVFATGDAINPPLEPASADVIANRNILWTLLEPATAFRNWFSALRPGGRMIAFHGINNSEGGPPPNTRDQNNAAYSEDVTSHLLPIRRLPTVDPAVPLVREAGFQDVRVTRLQALEDFEREAYGADKTWLVITAMRPSR